MMSSSPDASGDQALSWNGRTQGKSDVDIKVRNRNVEDDETVEYIEEDDAIRYVGWLVAYDRKKGKTLEREPIFEPTPFERWGETQCLSAVASAAGEHVNTTDVSSDITSSVEGESRAAVITVTITIDRNGTIVSTPAGVFEALVSATPAVVTATYLLDEHEYELNVPVYACSKVVQFE